MVVRHMLCSVSLTLHNIQHTMHSKEQYMLRHDDRVICRGILNVNIRLIKLYIYICVCVCVCMLV